MSIQTTSLAAFHGLRNLPTKKQMVFDALALIEPACNLDIAYELKWPINRVTPRMNELVKDGRVVEHKKAKTPRTGKMVIFWKTR